MLGSGIPIRSSLIAIENCELIVLKIDGKGYSIPRENFYNREEMLKNGH